MKKIIAGMLMMLSSIAAADVSLSVIETCEGVIAVRVIDEEIVILMTPQVLLPEYAKTNPDLNQYLKSVYKRAGEVLNIINTCHEGEEPIYF